MPQGLVWLYYWLLCYRLICFISYSYISFSFGRRLIRRATDTSFLPSSTSLKTEDVLGAFIIGFFIFIGWQIDIKYGIDSQWYFILAGCFVWLGLLSGVIFEIRNITKKTQKT